MNVDANHFSVKYSSKLMVKAARYLFLQELFAKSKSYWRELLLIMMSVIAYVINPERSIQFVQFLLLVDGLVLFFIWLKRWLVYRKFRSMFSSMFGTTLNEEKTFRVESDALVFSSPNSETRILWASINEVWNCPRFLYLFFHGKLLFFPIAKIGEDARKSILAHVPSRPPVLGGASTHCS